MKTKITNRFTFVIGALLWGWSYSVVAEIPEGRDELRIHTGTPEKKGESIVSISGRWLAEGDLQTGFTALTFINGPDEAKADSALSLAKKVAKSAKRGMAYLRISLRGLAVEFVKDPKDPQYVIRNKEGIPLSKITIRDFTNQKFTAEIGAKSFNSHGTKVALDFVEGAAVAKIVLNFSADDLKTFHAEGGGIDVTMGDGKTVSVETANKTTKEIEKALAAKVNGSFSSSPLFPDEREKRDKKNIKPFDGGEVALGGISAKTFTVHVKDPSIGVVTRFQFKESAKKSGGWW